MDCEFCAIVAGERDVHLLYEDERTLAFLDENPAVEGHTLVVPRSHHAALLESDDAAAVFDAVETVSDRLDAGLDPDGFSVFYTTETLVRNVTHAHGHLLPREDDDGVSLALDRQPLDEVRAADLTNAVRAEE